MTNEFYGLTFTGDFVRLSFTKPFAITPQTAHDLLAALAAHCHANASTKVFVEGLAPSGGLSTEELYKLGVALSKAVPGVRVAVYLQGGTRNSDREFFKDVASNRGANLRYFASADEAAAWLGSL